MKKSATQILSFVLVVILTIAQINVIAFAGNGDLSDESEVAAAIYVSEEITPDNDELGVAIDEVIETDGDESDTVSVENPVADSDNTDVPTDESHTTDSNDADASTDENPVAENVESDITTVETIISINAEEPTEEIFRIFGKNFDDTVVYGDRGRYVISSFDGINEVSYECHSSSGAISISKYGELYIYKEGTATIKGVMSGDKGYEYAYMDITAIKKSLRVKSAELAPKVYDGTTSGRATRVEFFDDFKDELAVTRDFTALVEYDNENAGNNRTATVSVYNLDSRLWDRYEMDTSSNTCQVSDLTIEKASGDEVSVPTLLGEPTGTAIAVSPVSNEGSKGQNIEYAISQTSDETPISGWQTDTTFNNLTPATTYYVYARTQESGNYDAGTAQQSAAIMTAQIEPETHLVTFSVINGNGLLTASVDNAPITSGDSVLDGKDIIFTAAPDDNYKVKEWTDNGNIISARNNIYELSGISGSHTVAVEFEHIMYPVAVNSEGENPLGSGNYKSGSEIYISAGNPPANKRFSYWETSSTGVIFNSPISSETYFIMPANAVAVTAVFKDVTPTIDRIAVTPDIVDVQKGASCVFSAEVHGEYNPDQSVTWEVLGGVSKTVITSDGTLSVSANETATTLTVKATSTVDSDKFGIATVNVTEIQPLPPTVTGVAITPDAISLIQGSSHIFTANITGDNDPPQSVEWSVIGGTAGTEITSDGELFIDPNETADILSVIATSKYNTEKSGTAIVTVIEDTSKIPTVSSVDVSPDTIAINKGDTYSFTATVTGQNNPLQTVIWSVINGNGVTNIDSSGKLTVASNESTATLTVKATSVTDNAISGTATVTVLQPPASPTISSVEVTPSTATVEKGSQYTFTARVTGQNNPPQSVAWSVSGGVGGTSIDENGVLTVSDSETADTITVTATSVYDSSKSGTAVVTVPPIPTVVKPQTPTITSNPQSVTVYVGDRVRISVAASVTDGGELSYQWYRNSVNSSAGGTLIEGATSPSYTPPTGTVGATYYYVVVTNTTVGAARSGAAATASNTAVLTVRSYPSGSGSSNGGSGSGNSGSSGNRNTDNGNGQNNTDQPTQIKFTASKLKDYADKNGNYVIKVAGQTNIHVTLPISALKKGALTVKIDFGTIAVPNTTLQALRNLYGDNLRLNIKKGSFIIPFGLSCHTHYWTGRIPIR